jgi:hypothetical protein
LRGTRQNVGCAGRAAGSIRDYRNQHPYPCLRSRLLKKAFRGLRQAQAERKSAMKPGRVPLMLSLSKHRGRFSAACYTGRADALASAIRSGATACRSGREGTGDEILRRARDDRPAARPHQSSHVGRHEAVHHRTGCSGSRKPARICSARTARCGKAASAHRPPAAGPINFYPTGR